MTSQDFFAAALALPEAERGELAAKLLETFEQELGPEFEAELERRAGALDSGKDPGATTEELMREVRSRFAAVRTP